VIRETGVLVRHSLGRLRTTLIVMAGALAAFQVLLALAAAELQRSGTFTQLAGLIPSFVRELVGTSLVAMMSFSGIMALGYYHVAIVAVLVGLVVAVATEPTAEIEVGFADLVLSRPVARAAVMTRSVLLIAVCPAFVIMAMVCGTFLGLWLAVPTGVDRPSAALVWALAFSLWALLACWGGVSLALGSASRRRAVAGAVAGSLAAALMLVDYLSRVWKPLQLPARLSPFHYYNPLELVTGAPLPVSDIGILLGTGALAVVIAYVLFLRRDI
jgi:ABC-type transport system involved in multi-copper enzyme maturation permease subunit